MVVVMVCVCACVRACMRACVHVCAGVFAGMEEGWVCMGMHMCPDMCTDVRMDICIVMCIVMCIAMRSGMSVDRYVPEPASLGKYDGVDPLLPPLHWLVAASQHRMTMHQARKASGRHSIEHSIENGFASRLALFKSCFGLS